MTPWTALLESLHSAVIDELNARFPSEKLELGMPLRKSEWSPPADGIARFLAADVSFGGMHGIVGLAADAPCEKALGREGLGGFWAAIQLRAGTEFGRRGIRPRFGEPMDLAQGGALPRGFPQPSRIVWIPIGVRDGKFYLGVAAG